MQLKLITSFATPTLIAILYQQIRIVSATNKSMSFDQLFLLFQNLHCMQYYPPGCLKELLCTEYLSVRCRFKSFYVLNISLLGVSLKNFW